MNLLQQNILNFIKHSPLKKALNKDKLRRCPKDIYYFYICTALSCTVLVYPVCANPIPFNTIKVSEMPFSHKLSNPCALLDANSLQRSMLTQENIENTRRTVINEMKAKASLLKESAETILRTNLHLNECSTLVLPSIATIPSEEDISSGTPLEVLHIFYTSLLNHTAYMFFISEQIAVYSHDHTCNSPGLYENSRSLASEMQSLMCALRYCSLTLKDDSDDEDDLFDDSTDQILNEHLSDQCDCSKRSFRDCQTIRSTAILLRELTNYLQNTVLDDDDDSDS